MKLIKGSDLTPRQYEQILAAYIYRWTTSNPARVRVWANISSKPTMPLVDDNTWTVEHAFWFINDGSRLSLNRHHAEPVYMAD